MNWNTVTTLLLSACCLLSPGRAQDVSGELAIAAANEFEPTTWTWTVDVPAGTNWKLATPPFYQVQRKQGGAWRMVEGPPGRNDLPPRGLQADYGEQGRMWHPLPMAAGGRFEWSGELADWRVVAYPGVYRMRVRWSIAGERGFRFTDWSEFVVQQRACRSLQEAREQEGKVWKAFTNFMDAPLRTDVLGHIVLKVPRTGEGVRVLQSLHQSVHQPTVMLGALQDAPAGLKERLAIVRIQQLLREALAAPEQSREARLEEVATLCDGLMAGAGVYAETAKACRIATMRWRGMAAWQADAEKFWKAAQSQRVGVARGGIRKLVEDATAPPGRGPGLPWSVTGGGWSRSRSR